VSLRAYESRAAYTRRTFGALAASALCSACIPIVTHPPEVKNGASGGLLLSLGTSGEQLRGKTTDSEEPVFAPASEVVLRRGWAPADSARYAFEVAGQFSPVLIFAALGGFHDVDRVEIFNFSHIDMYVQAGGRERARLQRGAGIMVSANNMMPYVQFGRTHDGEDGWYSTQGIALFRDPSAIIWMPSIAHREGKGLRAVNFQLTGGLGARRQATFNSASYHAYFLLIGSLVMDFFSHQHP
jgi:hypothetical protein